MKISSSQPFKIIYSLFQHEYLGYLFESFIIHLDVKGRLTFQHQNISSKNALEFESGLDETDYKLIKLMDNIQQESIVNKYSKVKIKPAAFFLKIYDPEKGNKALQGEIESYIERHRAEILSLLEGKNVYEMGKDGEPAWKNIEVMPEKASVLFHFRKNEENTHYFPTIKHNENKLDFQYKGAYIICREPAWMILEGKLFSFAKEVDGNKIAPFLNKKFIVIPKKMEDTYYRKFVAPLVASFDVYAKGFDIKTENFNPRPNLLFSEVLVAQRSLSLFDSNGNSETDEVEDSKILFELSFQYGKHRYRADHMVQTSVNVDCIDDFYTFYRVKRNIPQEKEILQKLIALGLPFKNGMLTLKKSVAFGWFNEYREQLEKEGFIISQSSKEVKKYFLGKSTLSIEVKEGRDWFDIYAIVKFGDFEIPFAELRKLIIGKKTEVRLPNGETAVIPEVWFSQYSELFAFMDETNKSGLTLKKHHLSLVHDLQNDTLATVTMSRKLEALRNFEKIDVYPIPKNFVGKLRPYQHSGFNWLQFLNSYNFGGCLADDMGLGKTVQTLALLQAQKEEGVENATLLVMPTSLIYNWEMEAKKFTPKLKVFTYTGTSRIKDVSKFNKHDVILTSYGIARLDVKILEQYYFNYIILDESQAIKNPSSNISKSVKLLNSRHKLILTGTPLENSTLDLWSQMSFINPGLIGNQAFFKKEFLNPIEKNQDQNKTQKLHSIIKPFIMRRHKSQVATELPAKVENVKYSTMTPDQEEKYEEAKSFYRNKILDEIESKGVNKSQFLLLQGLTKLRQLANHPKMVEPDYEGESGKLEDVTYMLDSAISEGHQILIFSQFVKHLSILRAYLEKQEIKFAYLDGSTKDRKKQVTLFQEDESVKVFLISLKAGGLGLNLTRADYVFLLDPWWNPAIEAQAVDRAHRIGQKNQVFTYKFITKNTVEEKILALQNQKRKLADDIITTEESFIKSLKKDDILSLLD